MNAESVVAVAAIVGGLALAIGLGLGIVVTALISSFVRSRRPDEDVHRVNRAAASAEDRIADIHLQAHERLAGSVLRGAVDEAAFEELLRGAR